MTNNKNCLKVITKNNTFNSTNYDNLWSYVFKNSFLKILGNNKNIFRHTVCICN